MKGNKLEFISQIKRDGSGTSKVTEKYFKFLNDENFKLIRLSLTENTFIASGFNCFVVRIKPAAQHTDKLTSN